MSTDLHPRPSASSPPPADEPKPAKTGLSLTQLVGGALAAMTSAALGSRLSVAGTVVGAALASVVAAVAGAMYTASLRRTRDQVNRVITTRLRNGTPASVETVPETSADAAAAPARPGVDDLASTQPAVPAEEWVLPSQPVTPTRRARIGWKTVVAGAVAIFAITLGALTGFELLTGQAISGGQGTTVGQVSEGGGTKVQDPEPSASPTATPSGSPSASAEPSSSPTPVTGPEATPSATAEPTPSVTPSGTPSSSTTVAPSAPGASQAEGLPSTGQ